MDGMRRVYAELQGASDFEEVVNRGAPSGLLGELGEQFP